MTQHSLVSSRSCLSSGIVTFGDGENEASITLTVVQDNSPEPAEMFRVTLLPQSVTGNVVVEGVTVAHLLVEDSDDVYGTVEFGPGTDHMLITVRELFLKKVS